MDDKDRKDAFDSIAAILRQHGLGWVVDQVNEQIHNGKTEFVEVETIKRTREPDLPLSVQLGRSTPTVRKGPKARFPTTVDYSEKEKLALLLDGVVQAIAALEIESAALEQLKTIEPGISSEMMFFSEAANTTATVMSPTKVANRDRVVKESLDAIIKLREEGNKD